MQLCVNTMPKCKTSSVTLEEQWLLPIILRRVIRSFTNLLKSTILHRDILYTSAKLLRKLIIFPEVDVPTDSPQDPSTYSDQTNNKKSNLKPASETLQARVSVIIFKLMLGRIKGESLSKDNLSTQLRVSVM
ncbi:hypothetical protein XENORESO_014793 [Xenotaenia resolanae]|uniref:Uncharacterized protein n=1 Tax=Xenotaenia resolanae TaxID=208358 RepID=A0ABV0WKC6_9TELE